MIPYGRQSIDKADIDAVVKVLQSDFITQGPAVPEFEEAVCRYADVKYGVAVNSGTSALHIACLALDLGHGDLLWTTPITFVASANCALYCGAEVDFVDIDPVTWNVSVEKLKEKLSHAKLKNRLPKVVALVHFGGLSCDMEAIHALSKQYGFRIIEDACHAIGGKYQGKPVGCCEYSDITIFSFHPVKIITTAEGGMAMTNNEDLASKMALLRNHGITRDAEKMTRPPDGLWYYQQIELGYNYRMTDIQAALGISQLKRIDEFVSRRHEIANQYNKLMEGIPVRSQLQPKNCYSAMHLYVIRLQTEHITKTHRQVFEGLRSNGIGVNVHYIPVHTQPWYAKMGYRKGDFPNAERYYEQAISLPMFPELSEDQVVEVAGALKSLIRNN